MENRVNTVIKNFADFLNLSNTSLKLVKDNLVADNFADIQNDFYQVNWEILVESAVCIPGEEWLQIYGEGADCNSGSSRVTFPEKLPTHKIICRSEENIIDLLTNKIVDFENYTFNSFAEIPIDENLVTKFNAILLEHNSENEYILINMKKNIYFYKVKK
ncbi:hypothetical protein FIC_00636 [Flavobacteriaceae bacterium 3519-10]|nr:hypothetical protein FIC_00636 [Flavobacteriaceae bacterium 3519-10]